MTPNKMPNTPGDRAQVESPSLSDTLWKMSCAIAVQQAADAQQKVVPIYDTHNQLNRVDCAKLP